MILRPQPRQGRYPAPVDLATERSRRLADGQTLNDGAIKSNVWGTYLHGVFDDDGFRHAMLDSIRERRGFKPAPSEVSYPALMERNIDRWAAFLVKHLDMKRIEALI